MRKAVIGVAILVILVLALPFLIPADFVRAKLAAQVQEATGRALTISGAVRFRLVPGLGVTAEGVTFANAPGGIAPAMASIKSIAVDLRLLPLLSGRVEVARLVLVEPAINLEVAKSGRPNWQFDPPAKPAAAERTADKPAPPGAPPAISLDDVRIEGGRATYHDARTNSTQALEQIGVTLAFLGLDQPFSATGTATWNKEPVTLALRIAAPGALLAGKPGAVEVKLTAAPVNLTFAGELHGLPPTRSEGSIDITSPSLRRLAAWVGSPVTMPGPLLGPLAIKGRIKAAGTDYAFTEAVLALDALRATGDLKLATGGPRLALAGRLVTGPLDLNPYLPEPTPAPATKPAAAAKPAAADEGWSEAPIDLAALHGFDATLALVAERIVHRKLLIEKPSLDLRLVAGKLHADLKEITLYRGHGKATLDVDAAATPVLALTLNLTGADIQPLLDAAIGLDRLSGTGSLDLAATARGVSQRALIASLAGKGALNLADGQVNGVNLTDLARNALPGAGQARTGGATRFGTLVGTFTITDGVLRNDDLRLAAGPLPTTGAGTVNILGRSIDYRAVPQLAGAVKIPIRITGPWTNISYAPDGADALKGGIPQLGPLRGLFQRP